MPESTADLNSIHSRVLQHADKLFGALVDLEAAGGASQLAKVMKPKSIEALAAILKSTKTAIDEQLGDLKGVRKPFPKRRPNPRPEEPSNRKKEGDSAADDTN